MDRISKIKIPMVREYKVPSYEYWWWQPKDTSEEYVLIYPNGDKCWYKKTRTFYVFIFSILYFNECIQ